MKETVFYIVGIALAISAVIVSFIGLKVEKFPGKLSVVVVLVFAAGAIGAATFAVLYSKEHEEHREHELEHANEVFESEEHGGPFEEGAEESEEGAEGPEEGLNEAGGESGGGEASGPSGTLEVIANETNIAYEESSLETEAGEVEIDFNNPSAIEHDVKVEKDGEEIGGTDVITDGETSATVELEPGEYTFFCSIPGHREAGMEGPLTVK